MKSGDLSDQLLTKGLEEEVYAGSPDGKVVGLSHHVKKALKGFATEPDCRNIESNTAPYRSYDQLFQDVMEKRLELRKFLKTIGEYTLIPGGTLSLGDSSKFYCSDEQNSYYTWIREAYHTNIVTTSAHLNIGITDPEELMRAYRVMRMEACLFLAVSASSPFIDGKTTGFHSKRWEMFPKTPSEVPFFESHAHFKIWVKKQLSNGNMQNSRHLWLSVRPNGDSSPDVVNRLELRVCDHLWKHRHLMACMAFYEAIIKGILNEKGCDPLTSKRFNESELQKICRQNESAVSRESLNAEIIDWQNGQSIVVKDLLFGKWEEGKKIAQELGFSPFLEPLGEILEQGNMAQIWLEKHTGGMKIEDIIQEAIQQMEEQDLSVMTTRT